MTSETITRLTRDDVERQRDALIALLQDVVAAGAGIGFLPPVTRDEAAQYWDDVSREIAANQRTLLALHDDAGAILGTVQLAPAQRATGPHRAEVHKLMIHTTQRRRGHGARLMSALEDEARRQRRTLLCLDTFVGSDGQKLYEKHGWSRVGHIPKYAIRPDGELGDLALYYKQLEP